MAGPGFGVTDIISMVLIQINIFYSADTGGLPYLSQKNDLQFAQNPLGPSQEVLNKRYMLKGDTDMNAGEQTLWKNGKLFH